MKQNIILVLFGLVLGLAAVGVSYPLLMSYIQSVPEGASFESVEDFQRAMLQRDDRDRQEGENVSLRTIITPHPDEQVMYDLLPDQQVLFQNVPVRINSCGMRGPEVDVSRPDKTYRIAFLGDSFTFGWGVNEDEAFPEVTAKILQKKFPNIHVEALNFGVPGYSTFQEVALFKDKALDFKPDAVVVYFVQNDFGLPFFIKNVHQPGSVVTSREFSKSAWARDDSKIEEQEHELNSWLNPNNALLSLAKLLRKNGIDLYVAMNPHPSWKKDFKRLKKARKNNWITFIGMRGNFLRIMKARGIKADQLSLAHDPHPSPVKHRILADILASELFPSVDTFNNSVAHLSRS